MTMLPELSGNTTRQRGAVLAALIMTTSVALSKVIGIVREMVLAGFRGTDTEMDAYVYAFLIPELLNHLVASSALSIPFIPLFQRHILAGHRQKAWDLFSNLFTIGTGVLCVGIACTMLFAHDLIPRISGDNITDPDNPAKLALTVKLTRIILPAQLFFFWGALFNAVQYAHKRFLLPALTPVCYNLGIIGFGLLFQWICNTGITGFAWGVTIGAFIGNVVVQVPGVLRLRPCCRFIFRIFDSDLRQYCFLIFPLMIGFSATFSNEFLFRLFGSFFGRDTGAIARLNYSLRLMMPLVSLGQAFAVASFPFVSHLARERNVGEMNRYCNAMIEKLAIILIPTAVILAVIAVPVVALMYERGAFDLVATTRTAPVFRWYLMGAFACAAVLIVNRLYYALENTLLPMLGSTGVVCLSLPFYLLLGSRFGAQGIAAAASLSLVIQFIAMYTLWSVQHHNIGGLKRVFKKIGAVCLVSCIGGGCSLLITVFLDSVSAFSRTSFFSRIVQAALIGIPGLLCIITLFHLTAIQRAGDLLKLLFPQPKNR